MKKSTTNSSRIFTMKKGAAVFALVVLASATAFSQNQLSTREWSVNGFRNPSVGIEFRHKQLSYHAGYYPTAFKSGVNTNFVKVGFTSWFLPVGKKENPSSFYSGASYLRGLSQDYKGKNAMAVEAGFRWMVWKGVNLRIGAIAVAAPGESLKINPTPGISYSFFSKK